MAESLKPFSESDPFNPTTNTQTTTDFLAQLPKETWLEIFELYQWQGSWYHPVSLECALAIRSSFEARDDDIILVTPPKTGTTWLKALIATIMHGCTKEEEDDPLVKENPHSIVKCLEGDVYVMNRTPDLSGIPSPRMFHTHLPFNALPDSIKNSRCKMVYLARNPKDTFVSLYHFLNTFRTPEQGPLPLDYMFDAFCKGLHFFGPYLDHVLQYWKYSVDNTEKILFIKYEELKGESNEHVKRLAEFLGKPFGSDEEVEKVLWRCSLERLKNLEVNLSGEIVTVKHSSFFRLGVVGDWKNCLTEEMSERLDQITRAKLEGSGLDLDISSFESASCCTWVA